MEDKGPKDLEVAEENQKKEEFSLSFVGAKETIL